jgi:hypothetical protein
VVPVEPGLSRPSAEPGAAPKALERRFDPTKGLKTADRPGPHFELADGLLGPVVGRGNPGYPARCSDGLSINGALEPAAFGGPPC